MNPAASSAREDDDSVRALLHQHVADIHPTPGLIDRVEAGIRHRHKTRRIMLPVAGLTTAACVVALAFTMERTAAPIAHAAQAGRPVVTCPDSLPAGWMNAGVPAAPPVPGAARALLPGTPVAAVSCSTRDLTRTTTTTLTAQQISATIATLQAAPINSSATAANPPCEAFAQHNRPLYLIFGYSDGTHLTITAYAQTLCNGHGPVNWLASNGQIRTAAFQSPVLDSLSVSPTSVTSVSSP